MPSGPAVRSFQNTLSRFHLFRPGDRVLVALSGGADSVALLHLLLAFRNKMGFSVAACHVNHSLRGRESVRDERFVRGLCERWRVDLSVRTVRPREEARRAGVSLEMAARALRYRALEAAAAEQNCNRIATAHHLDDLAETVLLRLFKGTGLSVQSAIPVERDPFVRPLLFSERTDLESLLKKSGIRWVTDSTNRRSDAERNYLRNKVLPLLKKKFPAFRKKLAEYYEIAREEERDWNARVGKLSRFVKASREGAREIDKSVFRGPAAKPVLRRFLRVILAEAGMIRTDSLSGLVDRIIGEGGRSDGNRVVFASSNLRIVSSYNVIRIEPRGQNFPKEVKYAKLKDKCSVLCGGLKLLFEPMSPDEAAEGAAQHRSESAVLCFGNLKTITVRPRENGDYIRIRGGGKKKVKDLLMDRKIPLSVREKTLVLAGTGGREAVAVYVPGYGFRVSESFYVPKGPGRIRNSCWRVRVTDKD